jgi:Uma2 family endonuclease
MGAKSTRKRWTYSEFARLPTSGTTRYEIIDDELVVTPAPTSRHQEIVTNLVTELNVFVRSHGLGKTFASPLDVLFDEGDYLEPDIVFVRRDHAGFITDRGVEGGPPDLVVEVLSPSTEVRDRGIKLERYRLYGVPEYWVVDPEENTIGVWHLARGATGPVVYGPDGSLAWTPSEEGPTLQLDLPDLFGS